jgi:ribonuclease HI
MTRMDVPFVAIYADESCLGNGREGSNPGGAGGLIEYSRGADAAIVRRDYWISEPATTNNRMALRSVIEAFRGLRAKGNVFDAVFTSDSKYLISGMTEWVHGWARRGWRRAGGPIENLELWCEAIRAVSPNRVAWRWVRGHDGHPQNEYANHLATRAAREQTFIRRSRGVTVRHMGDWRTGQWAGASRSLSFPVTGHVPGGPAASGAAGAASHSVRMSLAISCRHRRTGAPRRALGPLDGVGGERPRDSFTPSHRSESHG